jgi:dodecin
MMSCHGRTRSAVQTVGIFEADTRTRRYHTHRASPALARRGCDTQLYSSQYRPPVKHSFRRAARRRRNARRFVQDSMIENKIVDKTFTVRGQRADRGPKKVPLLHIAALHDHVVPAAASPDITAPARSNRPQCQLCWSGLLIKWSSPLMNDHIYKKVELTGSSTESSDQAVRNAITKASKSLRHIDWFEVMETRGEIREGLITHWQVTLKVGFRLED